jgi:hypothetical protein
LRIANLIAALNCGAIGARAGLPNATTLEKVFAEIGFPFRGES